MNVRVAESQGWLCIWQSFKMEAGGRYPLARSNQCCRHFNAENAHRTVNNVVPMRFLLYSTSPRKDSEEKLEVEKVNANEFCLSIHSYKRFAGKLR